MIRPHARLRHEADAAAEEDARRHGRARSSALRWGDEATKTNRGSACSIAGAMLSRGTQKRTRAELKDALDRLRASASSVSIDGASIETVRASLAESLAIVAEMLREPSFPEAEFEQMKRQALTSIDTQRTDPQSLASLTIARHLNPYPPTHWHYTADPSRSAPSG